MKKLTLLLITMLTLFSVSAQQTVRLTVNGQGATKEEATANALRSAIEQSFGVFVSANTQILNDEVVKDEIATIASGNIQEYKELACITLPNGNQSVSLSATVSIGNLISYAKSKGSSAEFAGQVFAMNMKMRKLNAENEKKAIDHMLDQLAILVPDMLRVELSVGSPKKIQLENSRWAKEGANYYTIPLTLNYYTTPTSKSYHNILASTLRSISLSSVEVRDYKDSGEMSYIFNNNSYDKSQAILRDDWKLLSTDVCGMSFRTAFQNRLLSVLWKNMMASMFDVYELDFVGLGKTHFKYTFSYPPPTSYNQQAKDDIPNKCYLQLTDDRPIYDSKSHQISSINNMLILNVQNGNLDCEIKPMNLGDFNSVDALYATQTLNIVFEEGELYKCTKFEIKKRALEIADTVVEKEEEPYIRAEQMPSFLGGDSMTFRNWLYMKIAKSQTPRNGVTGRVLFSFIIEKDGSVTNFNVISSPDSSLSNEVERVLKTSPRWVSGKQGGKAVRVKITLSIDFR